MESIINKSICPQCGKIHDESVEHMAEIFASSFTEEAFPLIWKNAKEEFKDMKKRDLAEEMFYIGAVEMLTAFLSTMHDIEKKKK